MGRQSTIRQNAKACVLEHSVKGRRPRVAPKRAGNRGWSSGIVAPIQPAVSEFERVVERLRLEPHEYVDSTELRVWAEENKDARFVPERLLKAWGISLRGSIDDIG